MRADFESYPPGCHPCVNPGCDQPAVLFIYAGLLRWEFCSECLEAVFANVIGPEGARQAVIDFSHGRPAEDTADG